MGDVDDDDGGGDVDDEDDDPLEHSIKWTDQMGHFTEVDDVNEDYMPDGEDNDDDHGDHDYDDDNGDDDGDSNGAIDDIYMMQLAIVR